VPGDERRDGMPEPDDSVRVWLVERTFSDDEQNIIVHIYATPDGTQYYREERAITSVSNARETTAAVDVSPHNLGTVEEPDTRERYATEAERMRDEYAPDDVI
jgi:hypothetical protein